MRLTIDTDAKALYVEKNGEQRHLPLYSDEAFDLISQQWLKVGWNQKYPYTFTWMGRPIIQIPEDIVRIQEVVYQIKPRVIIETGVAHGGSLIFYASLLKAMGIPGKVIGVDIEIRPHNRKAIEEHELFPAITLIEGSSVAPEIVQRVRNEVGADSPVLAVLDSCHTKAHVAGELEAYHALVTVGSYIVATDGSMRDLFDVPRGKPDWQWNNAATAAEEFVRAHPEFQIEQPAWGFNESTLTRNITHWPNAFIRRMS